ncbi:MAG: hypothetical protein AB1454_01900 [Candidatus Auribacterota bacterium]
MKMYIRKSYAGACIAIVTLLFSSTASSKHPKAVYLHQSDFTNGTYIIHKPGIYRLAEDISFNPHPPGSLGEDGITALDAYTGGRPFPSQFGSLEDGKYDPAAFGIGFFAAIVIQANNVVLDLNGHTIEQSKEHALLQRFFAVIELSDQPFVPGQGPSDFGTDITCAENVWIKNGIIGRSAHHGIHGNANKNIYITNVDFVDFEVAAIALNGVEGLTVIGSTAMNREDVPIVGTFSTARFITPYIDWLVDTGSTTTLTVQGAPLSAVDIRNALRDAINNAYEDIITDGLGFVDEAEHPEEYALFHNKHGIIDGNAYGYLINKFGVAVGGFPYQPPVPSKNILFRDVHILSERAFINEVIALQLNGKPAMDPVGALFMLKNLHPDTGDPLTVSSLDDSAAVYIGTALSNAQALVAKASLNNEFPSFLSTTRLNITQAVIDWIENGTTLDTLVLSPDDYICNGDTMFHVNKGVIGFKMDAAKNVLMHNTSASNLENLGEVGSEICGNYVKSHPDATLPGYGGAKVRGYTFAGSKNVIVCNSSASNLKSLAGTVTGFDILTDSENISLKDIDVSNIEAGLSFVPNGGPNEEPDALGVHISQDAGKVILNKISVDNCTAFDEEDDIRDDSGNAIIVPACKKKHCLKH